jgi:predicted negative regulator of RcsB-dependent stress response
MSTYLSDDEQAEALKKWWKENAVSIIVGAGLGFGIIFGWQGWQMFQTSQGEAASQLYAQVEQATKTGADFDNTTTQLKSDYAGTAYASYAAMQQAKVAYKAGNPDRARSELEWVMANAPDPVLGDLARLRLAALLVDQQQYDAAKEVIAAAGTFMKGDFEQLQGDISRAQGDKVAALAAYQAAASSGVTDMRLLSMKIVDVTPVEGK